MFEALDIEEEIGGCSRDYWELVKELIPLVPDSNTRRRLEREERRLTGLYRAF